MENNKTWTLDKFIDVDKNEDECFVCVVAGKLTLWELKIHQNWKSKLSDCPIELKKPETMIKPILVFGKVSLVKNKRIVVTSGFSLSYESSCHKLFLPLILKAHLFKSKRTAERFSINLQFSVLDNMPIGNIYSVLQQQSTESSSHSPEVQKDAKSSSKQQDEDETYSTRELASLKKMSSDLLKLLEDKTSSDISLKCESETLSSHKIILSARSSVFETMFSSDFQEKKTGIVDIEDVTSAALNSVLRYIYGGLIPDLTVDLACEVLFASDKYQLQELKNACVEFLKDSLSVETVLQIFQVANLHDDHLKECAMNFVGKNIREVKKTAKWSEIEKTDPTLMIELMNFVIGLM